MPCHSFTHQGNRNRATCLLALGVSAGLWFMRPVGLQESIALYVSGVGFGVGMTWWILHLSAHARMRLDEIDNKKGAPSR